MSGRRVLVVAATEGELRGVPAGAQRLVCGVGPVDAGIRTATALASGDVDAVLHVGIAGVQEDSGIAVGDVVIGATSRFCDTGSQFVEQHVAPDAQLLAAVRAALPDAHVAPIGTSADVAGTAHHTDLVVEAMEGFAVLRAAHLAGVRAVEIRVISNEIHELDRAKWHFDVALTVLADLVPNLAHALNG
jgi:nucleoside phosphorylase